MSSSTSALTKLCGSCGFRMEASLLRCPVDGARLSREHREVALLGSYRLLERMGTGGMGTVYRAVHEKIGRLVAIKILNRSMLADRTNLARFFQEARSVNTIRHPNVVDIYDFVTAGKDIYMVMELLVGDDLHQTLFEHGGKPMPAGRTVAILEQVLGALQAAHDRGIIHRDLKPANVFLTRRKDVDSVKLLDFGLAKLQNAEGRMTRDGVVLGTPEYMAPEQARGDALDNRTDLYSVGCLAYHMLSGCQLFAGGSYADAMVRHVRDKVPPLRPRNAELPAALEAAVLRSLAKKPEDRPATARAFAEELCAAIDCPFDESGAFASVRSRIVPALGAAAQPAGSLLGLTQVVSRSLQLDRPGRRVLALGGLLAVAVAVGVTVTFRPGGGGRAPAAVERAAALPPGPALQKVVRVLLQSHPPGSTIFDAKGANLGLTPKELVVPLGSDHHIDFVLPGYRRDRREFRADLDTTIAVALQPERVLAVPSSRKRSGPEPDRQETRRAVRRAGAPGEGGSRGPDLDSGARTINPFQQ